MSSKELRMQRVQNGLCANCGKPNDREKYMTCTECSERQRRYNFYRKENHLCKHCGKPTDGYQLCPECRAKQNAERRKDREFAKKMGLCTCCLSGKPIAGSSKCAKCTEYDRNRNRVYSEEEKKRRRERVKRRRDEAKAKGLCSMCYKRKATPGYKTCIECRTRGRNRKHERLRRNGTISHQVARDTGICTHCYKAKATHGKVCDKCYESLMESLAKANAVNAQNQHWWVNDNKIAFLARA